VVGAEKLAEASLEKPGKQIDLLSRALESAMAATDTPDKVESKQVQKEFLPPDLSIILSTSLSHIHSHPQHVP
jgi:hypothetical protein